MDTRGFGSWAVSERQPYAHGGEDGGGQAQGGGSPPEGNRGLPRRFRQQGQQPRAGAGIGQQFPQRLFIRKGVEEHLILQRRGEEKLPLRFRERSGGVSAQQFFGFARRHGSHRPPMASSSC